MELIDKFFNYLSNDIFILFFFIQGPQYEKLTSRFLSNLRVTDAFINNEINLLVNHPEP